MREKKSNHLQQAIDRSNGSSALAHIGYDPFIRKGQGCSVLCIQLYARPKTLISDKRVISCA